MTMSAEEREVFDQLQAAIVAHRQALSERPGSLVVDWVLVVHSTGADEDGEEDTYAAVHPPGQSVHRTLGLLDVGRRLVELDG